MIHRFWHGDPHPLARWTYLAVATTQNEMPVEWSFANLPSSVQTLLDPKDDPRHLSNIARYALLFERGGMWLDHDVIPLERLPRPAQPYTAGVGSRHVACVMWFPEPGHPLLQELLRVGTENPEMPAPERSGGRLLNAIVHRYPDVELDRTLIPFDRDGHRRGGPNPKAVHLWEGSFRAANPGPS